MISPVAERIHDVIRVRGGHRPIAGGSFVKGTGYTPDRLATRVAQIDSRAFFASSGATQDVSLAHFRGPTLDQGQSGSCTGHGTSQAIYISRAAAGQPLPFFPSPRIAYAIVRVLELTQSSMALTDSGAMPSDLIAVVNKWGVAPIGFDAAHPTPDGRNSDIWSQADAPNVAENVNSKPSLLDLEQSSVTLSSVPLRVDEASPDFGAQIQKCLAAGIAGGVGIFVDTTNFMGWNPAQGPITKINLSDPDGGGHWLDIDYTYFRNGVQIVGGINSWSEQWPTPFGSVSSPMWLPGGWEMTLACLKTVISDCLFFKV